MLGGNDPAITNRQNPLRKKSASGPAGVFLLLNDNLQHQYIQFPFLSFWWCKLSSNCRFISLFLTSSPQLFSQLRPLSAISLFRFCVCHLPVQIPSVPSVGRVQHCHYESCSWKLMVKKRCLDQSICGLLSVSVGVALLNALKLLSGLIFIKKKQEELLLLDIGILWYRMIDNLHIDTVLASELVGGVQCCCVRYWPLLGKQVPLADLR